MTKNGKRVAWVTGGGSGIGEAGAEALAADGWPVAINYRSDRAGAERHLEAFLAKPPNSPEAERWIQHAKDTLDSLKTGEAVPEDPGH